MEFDKSKVYTTVNADELKIGSKGYFANTLNLLKKRVSEEQTEYFSSLRKILSDHESARFLPSCYNYPYFLFYLVKEQK